MTYFLDNAFGRATGRDRFMRNVLIAVTIYIGLFTLTSVVRTAIEQGRLGAIPGLWGAYALEVVLLVVLVSQPWMRRR